MKEKFRTLLPLTEKAETVFGILFLFYVSLGNNSLTYGTFWISAVMWPTYLLGAALLFVRVLRFKQYIGAPGLPALLALCGVCAVSILLNREYGLKKNVIYLLFWVFYFFLFYTHSADISKEALQKRFLLYAHVYCGIAALLTGVSLIMMAAGVREVLHINGLEVCRGFVYGRLFGAYLTPNAGAVVGAAASLLTVYFIRRYRSPLYRIAAALSIALHFAYLVFSDSRSGRVALAVGGAACALFFALQKSRANKAAAKAAVCALTAVAAAACLFFAPKLAQNGYNNAVRMIAQRQQETQSDQEDDGRDPAAMLIDRGYDMSGDISNRRFDVWESGVEIWKTKPVFGVTFAGFLPYAKENLPDTYIVTNDYMEMETMDSDPVNLLVSDGAAGVLCFAVFTVWALWFIFKRTLPRLREEPLAPVLFGVCAAMAAASLFASGVLYMQAPYSVMFWAALGLLVRMGQTNKQEEANA